MKSLWSEDRTAMEQLLDTVDPLVKWTVLCMSGLVFLFRTFSTKESVAELKTYVDARHKEAIDHADASSANIKELLTDMSGMLKTIDARTWEMQRDKNS